MIEKFLAYPLELALSKLSLDEKNNLTIKYLNEKKIENDDRLYRIVKVENNIVYVAAFEKSKV